MIVLSPLRWACAYLALAVATGLALGPVEGVEIGGAPLREILGNNLLVLLLCLVLGVSWGRCERDAERWALGIAGAAVALWFALQHGPPLVGLMEGDGAGLALIGLAPHTLLELGSFVLAVQRPQRWPIATVGVVAAAMIEAWIAPAWAALLGLG